MRKGNKAFSKKVVSLGAMMAVATMLFTGCGNKETKTTNAAGGTKSGATQYSVGIGQFAEHGSLDNCREGFLAGLKEEGIIDIKNKRIKLNTYDELFY